MNNHQQGEVDMVKYDEMVNVSVVQGAPVFKEALDSRWD